MTQIVLDEAAVQKLMQLTEPAELCDASGHVLGEFRPSVPTKSKLPPGFECPQSREELDRRRSDPKRFTTEEVLKHLESL